MGTPISEMNVLQVKAAMAKAAGVGLATVKRLETGVAPIPTVKAATVRALVELRQKADWH